MTRPAIILPLQPTPPAPKTGLASVTFEQRRRMTAAELIVLMGPLHVSHPAYKARPLPLLPMPNLAGRQPVIECTDLDLVATIKTLFAWACR